MSEHHTVRYPLVELYNSSQRVFLSLLSLFFGLHIFADGWRLFIMDVPTYVCTSPHAARKTTLRDMFPSATGITSFTLSKLSSEYVVPN